MAFDKVVDSAKLDSAMTATADAIRGKTGSTDSIEWDELTGFASSIDEISGGGNVPVVEKDVNFYDYDGTLLYSYTLDEVQALTELPDAPVPKKEILVFDEWNWTLADIKAYNNPLQVGAIYKTVDEKTYAVLKIDEDWQKSITIRYAQWCTSIVVDWGDGTADDPTTTSGGAAVTKTHTYAEKGTYIVTINANGTWNMGLNSSSGTFFGSINNNESVALRELYIGKGARLLSNAFVKAMGLEYITIPKTSTQTWMSVFVWCCSLRAVMFPSTFTKIDGGAFEYCYSMGVVSFSKNMTYIGGFDDTGVEVLTLPAASVVLCFGNSAMQKIVIPDGVQRISFRLSYCLKEVVLPDTVTTIDAQAFYNCYSMTRMRFKPTTPPTVENANAFTGIPTNCIVEVPAGTLATYQSATNYASIAAQMVEANE